jgi:hypothetical protein
MKNLTELLNDLDVLRGPDCAKCGGRSRLAGIEPHPREDHTDLRTYECLNCRSQFAEVVPLYEDVRPLPAAKH